MLKRVLAVLALACATAYAGAVTPTILKNTDNPDCRRWVDSVYNSLSERERIAQLIFPKIAPNQGASSRAAIKKYVETGKVGGLLFSSGTLEQYVEMTNYAQSIAKVPLMMTFDGEWGLDMRIKNTPHFPSNMALGAVSNPDLLYDYGREMARQCRLTGIQVNYAPVVDVNSNPANPVIGFRSFGEDPARVSALGVAYSRGLEDGGVLSTAKHFPGHGDTSTDSHKERTIVTHSAQVMDDIDLMPFRDYINAGLGGIMVGHIVVPSIDDSARPASLSHKISTELLRDRMGFEGLVFTDALSMKGARMQGLNSTIEALKAGADVIESSSAPMQDISDIYQAVKAGKISESVIEDRCRRVLRYKYALGLNNRPAKISLAGLRAKLNSPRCAVVLDELAQASITVLRNEQDILPLGKLDKSRIAIVNIGASAENNFTDLCRRYTNVDVFAARHNLPATTLKKLRDYDVVVAAVYNDSTGSRNVLASIADAPGLVTVFMVNPYKMNKFHASLGKARAIVLAYDDLPQTRAAAAMAIFGGIDVSGKLPVNLPRIAPLGTGIRMQKSRLGYTTPEARGLRASLTDSIDSIVGAGLRSGAFPGCQVLIARGGDIVFEKAYGKKGGENSGKVTLSTLYDLASVSKATGTLPGIMKAYDTGLFRLEDFASSYIPGLRGTGKDSITISQLLYHESGMPPALNMFPLMMDSTTYKSPLIKRRRDAAHTIKIQNGAWGATSARLRRDITSAQRTDAFPIEAAKGLWVGQSTIDTIMGRIYNIPLRKNNNYTYSCLNFCLLLDMEQRLTGRPHDEYVAAEIWRPLGAQHITYRPTLRHLPSPSGDTWLCA